MADEEQNTEAETETEPTKKPSLIKKLMMPLAVGVVVAGVAIGALSFLGVISFGSGEAMEVAADGEESADGESIEAMASPESAGSPAFFFSFYPDMLVNFTVDGNPHYLKVSIDVMSRDEEAIKGVEEYHSIMRNNLLKIFQTVEFATVGGKNGIDSLQVIARDEIRRVLTKYHGTNDVEGVYFTSFVVQ